MPRRNHLWEINHDRFHLTHQSHLFQFWLGETSGFILFIPFLVLLLALLDDHDVEFVEISVNESGIGKTDDEGEEFTVEEGDLRARKSG